MHSIKKYNIANKKKYTFNVWSLHNHDFEPGPLVCRDIDI